MRLFTFGDSHGYVGWKHADVKIYHGPTLAYSVGRDKLAIIDVMYHGVEEGDSVVFAFGEIDCRCHIKKYVTETTPYEEVIDAIVEKYIATILINYENLNRNIGVYVYNVVPPVDQSQVVENEDYPFLGTNEERKMYSLYFNKKLKEHCDINKFNFIDVYDKYADENGLLNKELSDGNIHIRDFKYIDQYVEEKIKKIL